jgi:hypothetical protein
MGVSVERLRSVNERLKQKISQKSSSDVDSEFTIDVSSISSSDTTIDKRGENLAKIPAALAEAIELDHNSDSVRIENLVHMLSLYEKLDIAKKAPNVENIFMYKAMNISGVGLKEEDFGEIREGKYVQIIAITYEPDKNGKKKAKNISLGYFGKAETLENSFKNDIIEFVLRWRYEKAFQNLKHYRVLLARLK